MFNLKEKFEFLEDGIDFPFYNDIPKLASWEWAILAIAVIFIIFYIAMPSIFPQYRFLPFFLVMVIPAIYICKGNYGIFFKKLKLGDIKTIILCFVGYVIYGIIVSVIISHLGYPATHDAVLNSSSKLMLVVGFIFQLLGEEFFKIFILLIVMHVVYKRSKNRNLAIWVGLIATLLIFGLAHMSAYGNLLQILLIQGLGSIFDLYAYMKTKNVVVSYIIHLMIDFYGSAGFLMG